MKNKGLGFKLALFIVTTTIVIVGLILIINRSASKNLLVRNVEENAANLTRASVHKIESVLQKVSVIPENEAHILEDFKLSPLQLQQYLQMVVSENDEIFASCAAFEPYSYYTDSMYYAPYVYRDENGLHFENIGKASYRYFYQDWYQIPAMLQRAEWSAPYYDEGGGEILMCTYSVPFFDKSKEDKPLRGIVTVDISLDWLEEVVSSIKIYGSGYAFLISSNGTFITHPKDNFEMHQTIFSIAEEFNQPQLREVGRKMIKGESGFIKHTSLLNGKEGYMYYHPLSTAGWSLAVVFPEEELFAEMNELGTRLFVIGVLGIMLLLILIIYISQRITKPLSRLALSTQNIGGGNFDVKLPPIKNKDEIGKLTASIDQMQTELKNYVSHLKATTAAKERIESELKIAHDIQQGIIPKIFPPFPDREDVDLFAVLDPARDVGGDLYDFFFVDDYMLCFAIGDVSGKGVPASLFMAITRTLLRAKANKTMAVQDIVKSMNVELCQGNENAMFVTFFLGMLDLKTGTLEYCNAGHNPPHLLRAACNIETISKVHGTPLGVFDDIDYGSDIIQLQKKDTLLLYTDGITEAMNIEQELYNDDRLLDFLKDYCNQNPEIITRNLVKEVKSFTGEAEQSDDITILALTYYLEKSHMKKDHLLLENKVSELEKLSAKIDEIRGKWDLDMKTGMNLNLVLEEVLTNIIFYAFDDDNKHDISINFEMENDQIRIKVSDDGKAFDPLKEAPEVDINKPAEDRNIGGLGIHFVKNIMDQLSYERTAGKNLLTMTKSLKKA